MTSHEAIKLVAGWLDEAAVETVQARIRNTAAKHETSKTYHSDCDNSKQMSDPERWRLCVHEAAHAVIHRSYGASVLRAKVSTGSRYGAVEYTREGLEPLGEAVGMLAGVMAELIVLGADKLTQFDLSHLIDVSMTSRMIADMPEELGVDSVSVATLAAAMVLNQWPAIDRVAASLRDSGTLVELEIAALCGASN
jgi:hypothetical protein